MKIRHNTKKRSEHDASLLASVIELEIMNAIYVHDIIMGTKCSFDLRMTYITTEGVLKVGD